MSKKEKDRRLIFGIFGSTIYSYFCRQLQLLTKCQAVTSLHFPHQSHIHLTTNQQVQYPSVSEYLSEFGEEVKPGD